MSEENNTLEGVIPTGSVDANGDVLNIELVTDAKGNIMYGSITAEDYQKVMKRPSVPSGGVLANIKRIAELEKENAELREANGDLEAKIIALQCALACATADSGW